MCAPTREDADNQGLTCSSRSHDVNDRVPESHEGKHNTSDVGQTNIATARMSEGEKAIRG